MLKIIFIYITCDVLFSNLTCVSQDPSQPIWEWLQQPRAFRQLYPPQWAVPVPLVPVILLPLGDEAISTQYINCIVLPFLVKSGRIKRIS